jgi:hypothetical protein
VNVGVNDLAVGLKVNALALGLSLSFDSSFFFSSSPLGAASTSSLGVSVASTPDFSSSDSVFFSSVAVSGDFFDSSAAGVGAAVSSIFPLSEVVSEDMASFNFLDPAAAA